MRLRSNAAPSPRRSDGVRFSLPATKLRSLPAPNWWWTAATPRNKRGQRGARRHLRLVQRGFDTADLKMPGAARRTRLLTNMVQGRLIDSDIGKSGDPE